MTKILAIAFLSLARRKEIILLPNEPFQSRFIIFKIRNRLPVLFLPVQAEGTINEFLFYFRAKYNEWTFAISENPEIDPVDIQFPETGKLYGFFAEGEYGGQFESKASYMDKDTAMKIIENSVSQYLTEKDKR